MRTTLRLAAAAAAFSIGAIAVVTAPASSGATKTGPPPSLTTTETYYVPMYENNGSIAQSVFFGGGEFTPPSWAKYVSSVVVTDATGLPVAGLVETESRTDPIATTLGDFCGRTARSYAIDPSTIQKVFVVLNQGPCSDGTIAAGSTGTISVTFTG